MENINIENVVEEVVEKVEETMPVPVQKNGVSKSGVVGIALVTYIAVEGVKWAGGKIGKLIKNRKNKKNKPVRVDEDAIEKPLPEIDEEENK